MRTVIVNGDALTIEDVVDVARGEATAELAASAAAAMEPSRSVVAAAIQGDAPVYGVNTGFGALADTRVGAAGPRPAAGRHRPLARRRRPASRWTIRPSAPCSCCGPVRSPRGTRASGPTCPPG